VEEQDILRGRDELAHRGLYVEPTSAIVWNALEQTLQELSDPVVVMLTGAGDQSAQV
jgi:threonine synthase